MMKTVDALFRYKQTAPEHLKKIYDNKAIAKYYQLKNLLSDEASEKSKVDF